MYIGQRCPPLTFEDLASATLRSAQGMGQIPDSFNDLPLTSSGEVGYSSTDVLATLQPSVSTPMPWGTLALVAAGLIVFGLVVGKR